MSPAFFSQEEYAKALKKGLPFPILTVAEYMSVDAEGFCWGRTYRAAGYYTCIFLWSSFVLWLLMNMLLMVVPRCVGSLLIFRAIFQKDLIQAFFQRECTLTHSSKMPENRVFGI